jgi:hypothetical protein
MVQESTKVIFPPLPIEEWEATKNTVHLFLQIVGKIRLGLFPKKNHWWHVPFYVSSRGVTTRSIPYGLFNFTIEFDFIDHALKIYTSLGSVTSIPLSELSVAAFYQEVFTKLKELGIEVSIWGVPYDVPDISTEPFASDTSHASYDALYVNRFWQILIQVDAVFQEFSGRFVGKCSPVHLFWHHFDLAVTRFSGKTAPPREGAGIVEREAYSHEVISFGFWAGDANVREPAFYAYAAPVPEGLGEETLKPDAAFYDEQAGTALLMYNAIRGTANPRQAIMDFLESFYLTAAKRIHLDVQSNVLPGGGSTAPFK